MDGPDPSSQGPTAVNVIALRSTRLREEEIGALHDVLEGRRAIGANELPSRLPADAARASPTWHEELGVDERVEVEGVAELQHNRQQ